MPIRPFARFAAGLALLAVLAGAGCSGAVASLGDREFLSVAVTDGGAARPLVAGTRIRLTFSGTNLGASAGCNSIGGTYRIAGGRLVFEGGAMTEMGCDPERHAQDDWLIGLLASSPTLRLAGSDLTLESGSVVVSLRDREVVEPDANIVGPTWTVESIITGDTVSSVQAGATATLVFNADGTLTVRPGCNQGGGTWKPIGGAIEVSALVLTKMACGGPGGQLESAVLDVLNQGTLAANIDSTVLTLQAAGRGLQLRAG